MIGREQEEEKGKWLEENSRVWVWSGGEKDERPKGGDPQR